MPRLTSRGEVEALPQDSIIGKDDNVYQRIHADDDPDVDRDGLGNPCVWAGIAFDNDPDYHSSAGLWHFLAECDRRHDRCAEEHGWVELWYRGVGPQRNQPDPRRTIAAAIYIQSMYDRETCLVIADYVIAHLGREGMAVKPK